MADIKELCENLEDEYYERFNAFFPLDIINPLSMEEEIKAIKVCLQTGTPYLEPEYKNHNVDY